MKKLTLSLTILLYAILAQSQTTVFNIGWNGTPEKILCAGDTWITYNTKIYGLGEDGKLVKYRKVGDEFVELGTVRLLAADELLDFKFINEQLHLLLLSHYNCDVGSKNPLLYRIDTSTFTANWMYDFGEEKGHLDAKIINDSTIFFWDWSDSRLFDINQKSYISHPIGFYAISDTVPSYAGEIFNGDFLLVYNQAMGLMFSPTNTANLQWIKPPMYFTKPVIGSYSYDEDSLIILTTESIYKLDTSFVSKTTQLLPNFDNYSFQDSTLLLFTSDVIWSYELPSLKLLSIDTLKGVKSRFEIRDVMRMENGKVSTLLQGNTMISVALNEVVLKDDVSSSNGERDYSLSLDSITWLSSTPTPAFAPLYSQVNKYKLFLRNTGVDTISTLSVLHVNHPYILDCDQWVSGDVTLLIPPGETKTVEKDVLIGSNGMICFYVSVPNHGFESDLSDNKICSKASLSLLEEGTPGYSFYPNPVTNKLTVEGDLHNFKTVSIYGIDGRQMPIAVLSQNEESLSLDMTALNKGVYFLQMHIGEEVFTEKIVKE